MDKKSLRIIVAVTAVLILSAVAFCTVFYGSPGENTGDKASSGQSVVIPTESDGKEASGKTSSSVSNVGEPSDVTGSENEESITENSTNTASGQDGSQYNSSGSVSQDISKPADLEPDLSVIKDYDSKYFVKRLSKQNKYYFCKLYEAVTENKKYVTFDTPIHEDEVSTLMYILNYDCPELVHLKGDYDLEYTGDKAEYVRKVEFSYCMTKKEYVNALSALDDFFSGLISDLQGLSDFEKEKYVYDYIFSHCFYSEIPQLAGSAYGSLIKGYGRCEAFCKGFMWCMRKLGIDCICVSGSQNWDPSSMFLEHSWNIVEIDGNWYHVDITVDNVQLGAGGDNPPNYGFFNVDDGYITESHQISEIYTNLGIPVCRSMELNYHKMNNLIITSGNPRQKLKDLMLEHFTENGIEKLSVKFETKDDYIDVLNNMEEIIIEFLDGKSDDVFQYNSYYNELSGTIIINIKRKDALEGE